jgi:hypothetical protein
MFLGFLLLVINPVAQPENSVSGKRRKYFMKVCELREK